MTQRIVPSPDIFAAVAIGVSPDFPDDPDLQAGIHLRLLPSPAIGFPLAPFGLYEVTAFRVDLIHGEVLWRDRDGRIVGPNLDDAGGYLTADVPSAPDGSVYVAIEVRVDGLEGQVSLLDRVDDRVLAVRRSTIGGSAPPLIVGGPRLDRLRIEGRSGELAIRMWLIHLGRSLERVMGDTPRLLGLPIDGDRPWYTHGTGAGPAESRVEEGAPKRLGPPDEPDGPPFNDVGSDNELARVLNYEPQLTDAIENMLADPDTLPSAQQARMTDPGNANRPGQTVDLRLAGSLLAQAMDPGIGRYLGVVDYIHERPSLEPPTVYAAIGLFAVDAQAALPDGRLLTDVVGTFDPLVDTICDHYRDIIGAEGAIEVILDRLGPGRVKIQGLIALAAAVPPPDPPELPTPELGAAHWLPPKNGPSMTFRQAFVIASPPLGSMLALARLEEGAWARRNEMVALPAGADPAERARAILLGRTRERPPLAAKGLISDAPVFTGLEENTYRFALADLFGRFGPPPADLPVPEPARPGPPTPAVQAEVVLDGPDGDGGPPASPGQVDVQVPVPSVTERVAGSLDIATLELWLDGVLQSQDDVPKPAPGTIAVAESSITLPKLAVGGQGHSKLAAVFIDTAGARSPVGEVTIGYADRRRPATIPTAIGIYWTSRPGPSEEVELKLQWPGTGGLSYRVYIADAKSLGLDGTRAAVAAEGGHRDLAHTLGGRESFRLLTEPPLTAVDGTVTMSEPLPRSLQTVQFLRIVPTTAGGREADFESCPVVAVAVPSDRRPPPPRVEAKLSVDGKHATITIQAIGLDLLELEAAEAGLFTHPPGVDAVPPVYRLRRAAGPVAAPNYATEIKRGNLSLSQVDGKPVFTAEADDPQELAPFVRYTYWAEVQMPPERRVRLEPGGVEIPPPGGVHPIEPTQVEDLPRLFSAASAPVPVLAKPPSPPPPLAGASAGVKTEAGQIRATLTAPTTPGVSKRAIGPYRLRIWEQWNGGEITSTGGDVDLDGGPFDWAGAPRPALAPAPSLTLHVVVIDPLGRESPLTTIAAH